MNQIADAIQHLVLSRPLTEEERGTIEDILDAARAWYTHELPFDVFRRTGTMTARDSNGKVYESNGYARAVSLLMTPKADPRRAALERAIEELCRLQDVVRTRHGTFERRTLHEYEVTVR